MKRKFGIKKVDKAQYCNLLIVLPMSKLSIFRGIAVSLLRPVIGSNIEIECRRCTRLGC